MRLPHPRHLLQLAIKAGKRAVPPEEKMLNF